MKYTKPGYLLLCYKQVVIVLYALLAPAAAFAQRDIAIHGRVTDEKNRPVMFASARIEETGAGVYTNEKGAFSIPIPKAKFDSITLIISYVDKVTIHQVIRYKDFTKPLFIRMQQLSLTLKDVQVSAVREKQHSASSIIFDREAIMQSQAFSLADILNKLPGKLTQAPALQQPQTLTLRTAADPDGVNAMNNSFGIAIYVDGVRMNNDANMQARSLSVRGMQGANITSHQDNNQGYDVPYNGFDLRDIPIENIERIEVIQGIADAKYGELTNGAILITTRAGRTPTNVAVNVNGGSTQFTGSKGFQLKGKAGAVNISAGYTNSNKDPRDKVKSYNRVNTAVKWTVDISPRIKNTFSFGYDKRLDNVKMDPDDDSQQRTFQKGYSTSLANRTNWNTQKGFVRDIDLNIGYSRGKQDTYNQWLLNGPPTGIADKDTTGEYEGYYVPGNYLAIERIIGIPVSVNGTLDVRSRPFFTGSIEHSFSMGASFSSSGNKGPGTVVDPAKPRWQGSTINYRSERPVDRSATLPFLTNQGYYIQDNISGKIFGKKYTATLGFRTDVQNGFISYEPRLGITYRLDKHWGTSFSYGISTKAPSLADRYPAPSWIDIPILQLYNGYASQSLFLVYTKKIIPDNSYLKAARNASAELGLTFNNKWSNGSLYVYAKRNTNGFNSNSTPTPVYIPDYNYTIDTAHKISYYPAGTQTLYVNTRYTVTNGLYTADYGAELMYATKELPAIATGFSVRSAFTYSIYDDRADTNFLPVNQDLVNQGKPALYGVYRPEKHRSYSLITTVSTITHIPRLGFTVTVSTDLTMLKHTQYNARGSDPLGYLDRNLQYVAIDGGKVSNTEYDYLRRAPDKESAVTATHFIYPSINITIAKEIRKKIRLMFTGYNIFNILPEYIDPVTRSVIVYNQPASLSAGITFQL